MEGKSLPGGDGDCDSTGGSASNSVSTHDSASNSSSAADTAESAAAGKVKSKPKTTKAERRAKQVSIVFLCHGNVCLIGRAWGNANLCTCIILHLTSLAPCRYFFKYMFYSMPLYLPEEFQDKQALNTCIAYQFILFFCYTA